ncbi:pyridoxamine 5'-phosphate oxidase family protein [Nocardioides sp. W7]|uniref:pyridoxamine 5'-phosphate oxidase family protein n=1 Tax=Nocardioides sp. W7 TaxID=2931390 RepID=UPI001FCFCD0A|nr:pyridoxamine 5'-phosphate oxidase family protein [Nocardioides sp. W7]
MTIGTIDLRFGDPSATAPTWTAVERQLAEAELYWLTTVRADGRPHVTPLVGVWHDAAFAFCTGVGEQKHVNLATSPLVAVTTGTPTWTDGTDLVIEGRAERVLGRDALAPLAAAWRSKYGADWAWEAGDETFTSEHGDRPWVYVVRPAKVIAFGKDPHSQTTYRP